MDLDTIYKELQEVRQMTELIKITQDSDHVTLVEHDKILVRGNGVPSLQETVRILAKTMTEFIAEVQNEKLAKKQEAEKWRWLFIGIGVPILVSFLGQALVFWFRVVPLIEGVK